MINECKELERLFVTDILTMAARATEASSGSADVVSIVMAVLTVLGAAFLFCFSLPLIIKTFNTHDTTHISYGTWSVYVVATFFLGIPSLVNSIIVLSGDTTELEKVNMIPLLIIGIANIIALFLASSLLILKAINCAKAKKQNITEAEYCQAYYLAHDRKFKKILSDLETEITDNKNQIEESIEVSQEQEQQNHDDVELEEYIVFENDDFEDDVEN